MIRPSTGNSTLILWDVEKHSLFVELFSETVLPVIYRIDGDLPNLVT